MGFCLLSSLKPCRPAKLDPAIVLLLGNVRLAVTCINKHEASRHHNGIRYSVISANVT